MTSLSPAEPPPGIKTVLVCDDERHILRLIEVNLTRQGYEVDCVDSGRDCLGLLGERTFDLLVLDVDLTGDLLEVIGQDDRHRNMKIVLIGSKTDDPPPPGASYIAKPFNPTMLVQS